MSFPEDALSLDVRRDLENVDRVMTQVISDPRTTEEFIRDPSGVLTRLGLHPRTTPEIHDRVNRTFYAVLTNRELLAFLAGLFSSFEGPHDDNDRVLHAALGRGAIENTLEIDAAAIEHTLREPNVVRRIHQLMLHDLNNRRLLQRVYSTEELDDYVERLVEAITERRAIRDHPTLEEWDANYGVGKLVGVGMIEVGPIVTVGAVVEVAVWTTVVAGVDGDLAVRAADAASGDPAAARRLATAGALLRLAGEMMVHAGNVDRS